LRTSLAALGLTVNPNGDLTVDTLRARKVALDRLEVRDQRTGDIYCTWLDYGEWIKVLGECDTIEIAGSTGNVGQTSSTETQTSDVSFTTDTSVTTTITETTSDATATETTSPASDGVTSTTDTTSPSEDGVVAISP